RVGRPCGPLTEMEPDVAREGFRLAARVDLSAGEVPDQREFLGSHRLGRRERDVLGREPVSDIVLTEVTPVDRGAAEHEQDDREHGSCRTDDPVPSSPVHPLPWSGRLDGRCRGDRDANGICLGAHRASSLRGAADGLFADCPVDGAYTHSLTSGKGHDRHWAAPGACAARRAASRPAASRLRARISSNGYLPRPPLPLGYEGESVVVLNDCLDILNDMLFDDAELARVG